MRRFPLLLPALILLMAAATLWRPWDGFGYDGAMLWASVTSFTHDGDTDITDDLLHASNPADIARDQLCFTWPTGASENPFAAGVSVCWAPVETVLSPLLTAGLDPPPRFHPRVLAAISLVALALGVVTLRLFMALAVRAGFDLWPAALAAVAMFFGSALVMFTLTQPTMSHPLSALAVAAHLGALLRWRVSRAPRWAAMAGLMAGIMVLARWQNVLFLTVAVSLGVQAARTRRGSVRHALLFAFPLLLCAPVQPLVWWLNLGTPFTLPQGSGFLHLTDPALASTLLCGHRGLFPTHPAYLVALIGLALFARRDPWLGAPLLVTFALITWINASVFDWWAEGCFGARRFSGFAAPAVIGFAEIMRRLRAPAWRGVVIGLILLWGLIGVRLFEANVHDLTLLFTGRPAQAPRLVLPDTDVGEMRARAASLLSDPADGIADVRLWRSLRERQWPMPRLSGLLILAGIAALAVSLDHALRRGGWLRRRWLVVVATALGSAWVAFFSLRLALDDRAWQEHGAVFHSGAWPIRLHHSGLDADLAVAEARLRQIPPEASQFGAAHFLLADMLWRADRAGESVALIEPFLRDDTPHRFPPLLGEHGLLRAIDEDRWAAWRAGLDTGGMR